MDLIERFLTTFDHEEPDRVPSFVQGVMPGFMDQWLAKYEESIEDEDVVLTPVKDVTLHVHLGFDSSWCGVAGPKVTVSEDARMACERANEALSPEQRVAGYHVTQAGTLRKTTILPNGRPHSWMVEGTLTTREAWESFYDGYHVGDPPANAVDLLDKSLEAALAKGHLLVPSVGLLVEALLASVGVLGIAKFSRRDPSFFRRVCATIAEVSVKKMKVVADSKAPLVVIPDDCAFKGRPIMSPHAYEEFVLPHLKEVVRIVHAAGKKVFLHSDGYVEPYYPLFDKAGLDGHQSLEPAAGMDLAALKEKWGDRFVLIGNLDCSRLLPLGSPGEVVAATRECLKVGAPGGGYVFSPCTDLTDACKLSNVEAMMAAFKKYGKYPVRA
ncbi:MAG: hypothetical protein Kow0069_22830 [Promethearchaeota archaeon]